MPSPLHQHNQQTTYDTFFLKIQLQFPSNQSRQTRRNLPILCRLLRLGESTRRTAGSFLLCASRFTRQRKRRRTFSGWILLSALIDRPTRSWLSFCRDRRYRLHRKCHSLLLTNSCRTLGTYLQRHPAPVLRVV